MALHYAIKNKMLVEIRTLVEGGFNTNARDKDRDKRLRYVVPRRTKSLLQELQECFFR